MDLDEEPPDDKIEALLVSDPDEFEEEVITSIDEAFDVMVTASGIVHRNAVFLSKVVRSFYVRALRPMVWIVTAMVVVMVMQQISLINRDDKVEELQETVLMLDANVKSLERSSKSTQESAGSAQLASEAAKASLEEALAQSQRGGVSPEVTAALNRINEIYAACVERKECGQ